VSGIYTVLARKWRPHHFTDVVGQDVIVRTLTNSIDRDRVAHAYLFAGSRGTGKTTVARILSRALNCEKGPKATPCDTCDSCNAILAGTSLDVLEIDGASTRGIDDVRQLREDVKLASIGGRKKVYIIDEVHMLTTPAFNALLKTLEEPPAHVVFVLATTDPQKVPDTILSRCQRFNFARISAADTVSRLKTVVGGEKLSISDDALMLLARRSGGALRDALGFLDQVVSAGVDEVDEKAVVDILGLVGSDVYLDLIRSAVHRDPSTALEIVWNVQRSGHDLEFFVQGLLDLLRNLLVIKSAPRMDEILEVSAEERKHLSELAAELELGDLLRLIRIMVDVGDQIRRSDYPWVHLEVAIVEMASLDSVKEIGALIEELRGAMSTRSASPGPAASSASPPPSSRAKKTGSPSRSAAADSPGGSSGKTSRPRGKQAPKSESGDQPAMLSAPGSVATATAPTPPPAVSTPATADAAPPPAVWDNVLEKIKDEKPLLWSILSQGELGPVDGETFVFKLDPAKGFHVEQLREPAHIELIESHIEEASGRRLRFHVRHEDGAGSAADGPPDRPKVLEDPFVKKVLELLDGEIVG